MTVVSIIVPVYNRSKVIARCLHSIQAQTFRDFEVIVINDGSIDYSGEIIDEFSRSDKRFRIVHQENAGVSAARNVGLSRAQGKYIAFVDSDDYLSHNYIEFLVKRLQTDNVELVAANYFELNRFSKVPEAHQNFGVFSNREIISVDNFYTILFEGMNGALWAKLFLREIIHSNNLCFNQKISFSEDLIFVLQYLNRVTDIAIINKHLYYYDNTGEGLSSAIDTKFLRNIELTNQAILKYYKGTDAKEVTSNRLKMSVVRYLYNIPYSDLKFSEKKVNLERVFNNYRNILDENIFEVFKELRFLNKQEYSRFIIMIWIKKHIQDIQKLIISKLVRLKKLYKQTVS